MTGYFLKRTIFLTDKIKVMKYVITGSKILSRKHGRVQVWVKENDMGNPIVVRIAESAKMFNTELEAKNYIKDHKLNRTYSVELFIQTHH